MTHFAATAIITSNRGPALPPFVKKGAAAVCPSAHRHFSVQGQPLAKRVEDLRVCFVPTPMTYLEVPGRNRFWSHFDRRYYAAHPDLQPTDASIWELPHWIPWLAGVLRAEGIKQVASLKVRAAVPRETGIDVEGITREFTEQQADVYLYSPMTVNLSYALRAAALAKETNSRCINVFGGIAATPLHQEVARHSAVDFVVRDRGELALPALLKGLSGQGSLRDVKNLTYKSNSDLHTHPELYPYLDPADLPFPFYDIFPKELGRQLRYIRQNYALGCPFKCSFCTIQTIGRKPGHFPIQRVLEEIRAYRDHYGKHHGVYFGDETFTLNKEKTLAICEALQKEGNIPYDIQTRLMSLNNDTILKALAKSGCKWVEVGLESISQNSMNIHKQGTNLSRMEGILKKVQDYGLPACSFIMHGLPEQTLDEMRSSVDAVCDLLSRNLLHATYFNQLIPYPGSGLYTDPEKYGLTLTTKDFDRYNEEAVPPYGTRHATPEQIYEAFLEGVQKLSQAMSSKPLLGKEISEGTIGPVLAHP